jgi:hypothetical protein
MFSKKKKRFLQKRHIRDLLAENRKDDRFTKMMESGISFVNVIFLLIRA